MSTFFLEPRYVYGNKDTSKDILERKSNEKNQDSGTKNKM